MDEFCQLQRSFHSLLPCLPSIFPTPCFCFQATKYLVGTESGDILSIERKAKKDQGSQISVKQMFGGTESASHLGPVYSVKRNPANTKYFLSVGDWSSKLWFEDLKSPVVLNRYESSYVTAGCWSPTRPGVFFTAKMDGTMDIWDIFYKQNEPVFPTKVPAPFYVHHLLTNC